MLVVGGGRGIVPGLKAWSNSRLRFRIPLQDSNSITWTVFQAGIVLSTLALLIGPADAVSTQPADFISIDCGGPGGIDPVTTLEWVPDDSYLVHAKELKDNGIAISAAVKLGDAKNRSRDNAQQLESATVFIPGVMPISKYCYSFDMINVSSRASLNLTDRYLLRATFPSSNLYVNDTPITPQSGRFYYTVDSTFIKTINLDPNEPQTVELLLTPLDQYLYICLVPLEDRSSMPAISSLELRPIDGNIYNASNIGEASDEYNNVLKTYFFQTVSRLNFGGDPSNPSVRYPEDLYDRFWKPAEIPEGMSSAIVSRRRASAENFQPKTKLHEPAEVLLTAWEGVNVSIQIPFTFNITGAQSDRPVDTVLINFMFLDVHPGNGTDTRSLYEINLQAMGEAVEGWDIPGLLWYPPNNTLEITDSSPAYMHMLSSRLQDFDMLSGNIPPSFGLPSLVNAAECYAVFEAKTKTANVDAHFMHTLIGYIKRMDIRIDTAGDPCSPVSWAWLSCSSSMIEMPPRITHINLTNTGLGLMDTSDQGLGYWGFAFERLDRLTVLDLSNNSFQGNLQPTLLQSLTLRTLNLAHNNLSGELLPFYTPVYIESLSLKNNSLSGSLDPLVVALGEGVFSLDMSHNQFNGSLPAKIGELKNLQRLDLSFNQLSGAVNFKLLNLSELKDLDLSHNQLNGSIPEQTGKLKNLQRLDLSFNQLSGTLDTELVYLSELTDLDLQSNDLYGTVPDEIWDQQSKLENVNLNDNNFTELNLTTWSRWMISFNGFNAPQKKVYLNHNNIRKVILPNEDGFDGFTQPSVAEGFILLGGNPWCNEFDSAKAKLVHIYLCRFNESEPFESPQYDDDGDGETRRLLIIIGVSSGLLVLLMACILVFFVGRTWKRMHELHEIQEALAKDDVRPPFFKYEELKFATGDFSQENQLGKGGFGEVYKAVLGDGSIVAVKRLLQTEQNLIDFLKEMVLITGIKHRNLIQLKGCCVRDKHRILVYEYAENKNLAEALWGKDKPRKLTWAQRLNICVGIARGLAYLHEELQPKIIHRDIKPQNILLDRDLKPKIADFGLARPVKSDATQMYTHVAGTLGYLSPEYAISGVLSEKLDVYSYGVLVLEIISGRKCLNLSLSEDEVYLRDWAVNLSKEDNLLNMVEEGLLATASADEIVPVLKTALSCLQEEPNRRPKMSQVVNKLMGNSDLGVDIIKELTMKSQLRPQLSNSSASDHSVYWNSNISELGNQPEKEDQAFLHSISSRTVDYQHLQLVDLRSTKPSVLVDRNSI